MRRAPRALCLQFAVEVGKITSLAVVRDIKMKATIRILLKPFFDRPPMFQVGRARAHAVGRPHLAPGTLLAGELRHFPLPPRSP